MPDKLGHSVLISVWKLKIPTRVHVSRKIHKISVGSTLGPTVKSQHSNLLSWLRSLSQQLINSVKCIELPFKCLWWKFETFLVILGSYVARTLLSWSRIVSETCSTRVSDAHTVCILKNLSHIRMSCPFQYYRVHAT